MPDPKGRLVTPVGFRSDGTIHSLALDGHDNLYVTFPSPSGVTPLGLGFAVSFTLAGGTQDVVVATVPTSQTWRMTSYTYVYTGVVANVIMRRSAIIVGTTIFLDRVSGMTSGAGYGGPTDVTLNAGDSIGAHVIGATAGDILATWLAVQRLQ